MAGKPIRKWEAGRFRSAIDGKLAFVQLAEQELSGSFLVETPLSPFVRLDDDIKAKGNAALAAIGLSAADAVRLLYHRIVAEQAFPLELKVPNVATREAIAEADAIIARRAARYGLAEAMIDTLSD